MLARHGEQNCCSAANGSAISASFPTARSTWKPAAPAVAYSSSAVLPMPGSPCTTIASPWLSRAARSSRSIASHSRSRPSSGGRASGSTPTEG